METKSALVPSVVGVGSTDMGLLSLGAFNKRKSAEPLTVQWNGTTYLAGDQVQRYARPTERMDFARLGDSIEARILTYAALGKLFGAGQHAVALMVGMPVQVMRERDLAQSILKDLKGWLLGTHTFIVNKKDEVTLDVAAIKMMAQPAGAFFAWGMNDSGKWARPETDLEAPVAVCDIGFNTLDLFTVQGGQVVNQLTGGDTAGVRRAAEGLARQVAERWQVNITRREADGYLREVKPVLYSSEGALDLTPMCQQALDTASSGIGDFVETRWGNGKQFLHLIFTGGGAALFRERLMARYPFGVVLPEPVMANALGLARYGQRAFADTRKKNPALNVVGFDPGFGGFKVVATQA